MEERPATATLENGAGQTQGGGGGRGLEEEEAGGARGRRGEKEEKETTYSKAKLIVQPARHCITLCTLCTSLFLSLNLFTWNMGRSGAIPLGMQKPGTSFTPVFREEGRRQKERGRRQKDGKKKKRRNLLVYWTMTRLLPSLHRLLHTRTRASSPSYSYYTMKPIHTINLFTLRKRFEAALRIICCAKLI